MQRSDRADAGYHVAIGQEPMRGGSVGDIATLRISRSPTVSLRVLALSAFAFLACCGGGGTNEPPAPTLPPGFKGVVAFPGFDLGRLSEQEPNSASTQPHVLPPCWGATSMRVGGTVGLDPAAWGETDALDHFGLEILVAERCSLTLSFDPDDRLAAGTANEFSLAVLSSTGQTVASAGPGPTPLTLGFDPVAGARYIARVRIVAGNAAYELSVDVGAGGTVSKPLPPGDVPSHARTAPVRAPTPCADGHILVGLRPGCDVDVFCNERTLRVGRQLGCGGWCVHFPSEGGAAGQRRARALARELAEHEDVVFAEPDWIVKPLSVPNDELFPRQWNMRAVGAPIAWNTSKGDPSIAVGVLDTGVVGHPDLAGRIAPGGYDFVSDGFSGDGDGRDPDPTDVGDELAANGFSTWHGTHVSAIIAANQDNGVGGSGIAPRCSILPIRVIGRGGGLVSDVADGLLYAGGILATPDGHQLPVPLKVVNLSIGLSEATFVMEDAINRVANVGTFIVAAAGNSGGRVLYPAAYAEAFAVAAVGANMLSTSYSNFGLEIELAAPGGDDIVDYWNDGWMDSITSALVDESVFPPVMSHGAYVGTSQAAPHVAGAAALLLSIQPNLTRSQIRQYLIGSALDLGVEGKDQGHGWGLLQVHEAVKLLMLDRAEPVTDPPRLVLPASSIRFEGFSLSKTVPLLNEGGDRLELSETTISAEMNGGVDWLSGSLDPAGTPGGPISHPWLIINVNRNALTDVPGQYTGHVQILDLTGAVLGRVEVVAHVESVSRAGCVMRHVVIDVDTGGAPRTALVRPEYGYRYWLKGMPAGIYRLRAGEDLDGNGLYCEPGEACGYFGGPTEGDAVPVEHRVGEDVKQNLDILVVPTSP